MPESQLDSINEEESEAEEADPELLFFIKNGHFEDDLLINQALPSHLTDNFCPEDYHQNDIVKMINLDVNKMTLRTNEEKEALKTALKQVMLEKKERKDAISDNKIDWSLFTSTISRIYKKLELSNFGTKSRE